MKISEIPAGSKLDFYVAKALGQDPRWWANTGWVPASAIQQIANQSKWKPVPKYSTDGGAGTPLIDSERIDICHSQHGGVNARIYKNLEWIDEWGLTFLEASMRCFVASKFGEEVPDIT